MENNVPQEWNKFYLKDVSFVNLMMRRIYNVLIVANPYDAFMLEDDGRIEEKIYNEYMELGLRYPPTFTQVSTTEEAAQVLRSTVIDLVICMPGNADNDAFDVARDIKGKFPSIHCVVLTPFSHGITKRMENEDLSIFDYVFCWLGNTNLILSIIKLIEDKMNLEHDIREAGVQMILLVEDSVRFYSSILPNLYNYILEQSKNFSKEALNRHAATMRMRGRPKVVLARTYEEAQKLYDKYSNNTLGVISDARFPLKSAAKAFGNEVEQEANPEHGTDTFGREKCPDAGLRLFRYIRKTDPFVPLIIESSESDNRAKAEAEGFRFVDKNSKKMSVDLRRLMEEHMGFGDFIFRDPKTHEEIMRIRSLKELQDNIFNIPNDSMLYHISRNHMSRWLCARAIFPVSAFLTFFVVGNFLETSPELTKRMVAEGHIVGNHTYHHPDMSKISTKEAFEKELNDVKTLFQSITGSEMAHYYRPPQGKYSTSNLEMAKELGYKTFFWSLAYVDWIQDEQPTKEQAFSKLLSRIHPGAVVLLHSTSSTNAAILDELLTKWEEMGYHFAPLSELADKL